MAGLLDFFGGNSDDASAQKWYQNFLSTLMNTNTDAKQFGQDIAMSGKNDLYNRIIPNIDNLGAGLEQARQRNQGLTNDQFNLDSIYNPMNFYGQSPTAYGMNDQRNAALAGQGQAAQNMNGIGGVAQQGFNGGGYTQQGQRIYNGLDSFMDPNGLNAQNQQMGSNIIAGGGWSPYAGRVQDAGTDALNRGGKTDTSNALSNFAQSKFVNGGLSPFDQLYLQAAKQGLDTQGFNQNSNALSQSGQGLLAAQGKNADNQFLTNRGEQILSQNPLLGMDEVTSRAADKASSLFGDQAKANYRQAMLRGGGPAVRSGLQNEALGENEDAQLRAVGDAITNARAQQQQLQLQHFGQGNDITNSGLANALSNYGLGGQLTGQGEQAALARMLGLTGLGSDASNRGLSAQSLGASSLGQVGQLENQNQSILGGLGVQGGQLANDKLNSGINLFGQTQGNNLNALNSYNNTLGNQNQYALGLGGLANNAYNGAGNMYNSQFGNSLAGDQFGLLRQQNMLGNWTTNLQNANTNQNAQQANFNNAVNPLNNYMNQGFNMYNNALNAQSGLFSGYKTDNAKGNGSVSGLVGGLLGAAAGAAS